MKIFLKIFALVSIPLFLIGLIFSENIKGYYRFKNMCEAEGGLRVYEKLERDVGWWAGDKGLAINAAMLSDVKFSRYTDTNTLTTYDVEYVGGIAGNESSYRFSPASNEHPLYSLTESTIYLDDNKRLKKISYLISKMVGVKVAEFNNIYYSAWGGNLGGPDWMSCEVANDWKSTLATAFK